VTLRKLNNQMLREQSIRYDVPEQWKVNTAAQPLQTQRVESRPILQPAIALSVRFDHGNGDYTIVLGSILAGAMRDPVEADYSFLDDE
jgi:hypothetical protein